MLKLRPTYEEIAREARTHRLRILPEKQKRTQQGILLDDVDFDDFDLGKHDKKTILMNENPQKGTQTDNFNVSSSVSESESMKTIEEVKQTQTDESDATIEQERQQERERERSERKSIMRRIYDNMFGVDEFADEREEMRNRRQQIEQEEDSEEPIERQQTKESDNSLPMNVKKIL